MRNRAVVSAAVFFVPWPLQVPRSSGFRRPRMGRPRDQVTDPVDWQLTDGTGGILPRSHGAVVAHCFAESRGLRVRVPLAPPLISHTFPAPEMGHDGGPPRGFSRRYNVCRR